MRLNIAFFGLGVWLLQQQPELPPLSAALLLAAALPAVLACSPRDRTFLLIRRVLLAVLCAALGYYWAAAIAHMRMADALPPDWEGRDVQIVGVVASLPQNDGRSVRFHFDVERVLTTGARVPARVSIGWWGGVLRETEGGTLPEVRAGERWELTVRLRRPRGTANPGGFDYEAWLLERGVRATGYVRVKGVNRRLAPMVHAPRYWVEAARARVRDRIERALSGREYAGVIVALAVGEQRAIPAQQWQVFTRTGVNHLMSISGLHVTMVSGLMFWLMYALWRRSSTLALKLPARKAAAAFGVAAALGYTLLAGFAVPAQRTLYMLSVAAAALWSGATNSVSVVLAWALLVVLLLDPWAVLAPGFWLSFGAVALILYVTAGRPLARSWIGNWVRVQWAVTLGLAPLLLALFQQVSIVSPLANAFAIPVVSLIVVPLALIGAVAPFDFVLHLAHGVMWCCMLILEWMSALPDAVWQQHAPPRWSVLAAVIGAGWLLLPRGVPARWLGCIAFLPMFFVFPPPIAAGGAKITVLDVGHGLAVVARTRSHALLYDTGPSFGPDADSGTRTVVPYLRSSGIRRLSGLVVSHDDIDHTGGAASVLSALPVDWLLTSLPDLDPLVLQADESLRCHSGQRWEWDGVRFEILAPSRESYRDETLKDNDRSCVLRIATRSGDVLLPADVERRGERFLLDTRGTDLLADVLLAPHQGSRTSSSGEFVEKVNPQVVIFPVGYRNRFGHPHPEVLARYRAVGSRIYRTDRDGAITLSFDAQGALHVEPYRAVYRRYWHTPFAGDRVPDPELL
ncbi:MAG: DNA internalization-related competence protein ComEC/Rec2 [Betaproteobacteria bacterium]